MVEFLTPAWVDALDAACREAGPPPSDDGGAGFDDRTGPLVVEQVVRPPGTPGDRAVRYHVRIDGPDVRVHPGPADDPTVVFELTGTAAATVARGERRAQDLLEAGDLRVRGRLDALGPGLGALRRVAEVVGRATAAVGSRTTYPAPSDTTGAGGDGSAGR